MNTVPETQVEFDSRVAALREAYPYLFRDLIDDGFACWGGYLPIVEEAVHSIHRLLTVEERRYVSLRQVKTKLASLRIYMTFGLRPVDPDRLIREVDEYDPKGHRIAWVRIEDAVPEATQVRVAAAIDNARRLAAQTCEFCGAAGVLRRKDWLITACERHQTGYGEADRVEYLGSAA